MRLLFLILLFGAAPLAAQPADTPAAQPADTPAAQPADTLAALDFPGRLVAGVAPAPPFAIKNPDGTWDGIAVELWRRVARQAGFEAELREIPSGELLDAVAGGAVDVALTLRASPEAEARADFAAPYYTASLGVAETSNSGIAAVLGRLFSPTFLKIAAGLAVLLLIVGVIIWLFERRDNEDDFREGKEGVWDGFWWAGVTMTTIGYGDKAPDSVGGKVTALLWMLVSMAVTASLTAALVSSLGLGGSGSGSLSIPGDLRDKRVGVVEGTPAAGYLEEEQVAFETVADVPAGLRAVEQDRLDAFVGPAPVLRYHNEEGSYDLEVGSTSSEPQPWAFAVAPGSRLREPLSRAVLEHTRGTAWRALLDRYLPSGS